MDENSRARYEKQLFDDIESLKPVITPGNSDSAALDNVFELLVRSGKSVSH